MKSPPAPAAHPELELQIGQTGAVYEVAFSPDGRWIASAGGDTIKLWDLSAGTLRRTLTGHRGIVYTVALSPDGATLASGGEDTTVRLWDPQTGALRRTLTGHNAAVRAVAFSPDGKLVASAGLDSAVKLWDAKTGTPIRTLAGRAPVLSLAFSADGKTLVTGERGSAVQLWDLSTGAVQRSLTLTGRNPWWNCIALSPDARTFASGSGDARRPGEVILWDAQTGAVRRRLTGHTAPVMSVAFAPDGKTLASGSGDGTACLWEADTGTLRRKLTDPERSRVFSLAFSSDGRTLAGGTPSKTVLLWDVETGALQRTLGQSDTLLAVAFSPDGKLLASGGSDQTVRLWDAASGALQRILHGEETAPIASLAFSPDGKLLASGSRDGQVRLWDLTSGTEVRTVGRRVRARVSLAYSPDGKTVAWGGARVVQLWDMTRGTLLRALTGNTGRVLSIAFSPDGQTVAGGSEDGSMRLWDARTGTLRRTLTGPAPGVGALAFSPDGKILASADRPPGKRVRLWNTQTGELLRTCGPFVAAALAFSPDGKILGGAGTGGDRSVSLWDVQTGRRLRALTGHTHFVSSIAFSPDGKRIASGSLDDTLRLWDAGSGRQLATVVTLPPARHEQISTDWLVITPQGYYDGSPGAGRFIQWRIGSGHFPVEAYAPLFHRPDLVRRLLRGEAVAESPHVRRFVAGQAIPPEVTFSGLHEGQQVTGDTLRVDLTVTDNQKVPHVELLVNGRPVDARLTAVGVRPIAVGAKPIAVGAKAISVGAKAITVGGKPIVVGAKPIPPARRTAYEFRGQAPLPAGEAQVTLKAIATDDEGLQGWAEIQLTRQTAAPSAGDLYVLAIGVGRYQNPHYNLKYAAADAEAFAHLWQPMAGKLYRRVVVTQLTDAQATTANVRAALFRLLETATNRDSVALFLSGHGVHVGEGEFYFATYEIDAATPSRVSETALPWTVFQTTLAKVDAKRIFLFLDACHSGSALGGEQASNERLAEALARRGGVLVFSSSRGSENSYEDDTLHHGAFTAALLEGIGEGKADLAIGGKPDGNITAEELLAYLRLRVPQLTKNRQTPTCPLIYDFGEAFLLARSR